MQRKDISHLDTELLAARMRTHRSRPVQPVATRRGTQYLRKHAIADVWISSDVEPIRVVAQKNASVHTSSSPLLATEPEPTERASVNTREGIDFAKNAAEWKLAVRAKKRPLLEWRRPTKAKLTNFALVGMAGLVFVLGLAAALHSFRVDRQITATVSAQAGGDTVSSDVNESKPSPEDIRAYSVAPDMPKLISIPALNVLSRIQQVGIDGSGALQAPYNVHDAAWYSGSVKPGSPGGASIIDGHISGPTQKGVFYGLEQLQPGDAISVEKGDGKKIHYKVVKVEIHDVNKLDMARLLLPVTVGKHGVNLISCTGKFNAQTNNYEQRVLVFAEAV